MLAAECQYHVFAVAATYQKEEPLFTEISKPLR